MVEVAVPHLAADAVWHVGRRLHVGDGQHLWCHHLPAFRMGRRSGRHRPLYPPRHLHRSQPN